RSESWLNTMEVPLKPNTRNFSFNEDSTSPQAGTAVQTQIGQAIQTLGLSMSEGRIYLHLARIGPQRAREVSDSLSIHRTETYQLLTSLQNRGLVTATFSHPIKYMAQRFEKALDILTGLERERLKAMENKRNQLMKLWKSLPKPEHEEQQQKEGFQILSGILSINRRSQELIDNAKESLLISGNEADMIRLYDRGILDHVLALSKKRVHTLILTSKTNTVLELLDRFDSSRIRFASPYTSFLPSIILADDKELLHLLSVGTRPKREAVALWTNYQTIALTMRVLFDQLTSYKPQEFDKISFKNIADIEESLDLVQAHAKWI
ncbi:MAG: TrmB family transcriptional regulator, partial [Candidatus Bathyarchaeia archaeon]